MANNQIPERLINYNVYVDGTSRIQGAADVELPSFEALIDAISGAGIMGEYDSATVGAFGPMATTINFRSVDKSQMRLASMLKAHNLSFRAAQQYQDADGSTRVGQFVVSMRVKTKTFNPGKLEANSTMDASFEGEVLSIRIRIDGVEYIELDKLNFVYKVNGVDEAKAVRDAI